MTQTHTVRAAVIECHGKENLTISFNPWLSGASTSLTAVSSQVIMHSDMSCHGDWLQPKWKLKTMPKKRKNHSGCCCLRLHDIKWQKVTSLKSRYVNCKTCIMVYSSNSHGSCNYILYVYTSAGESNQDTEAIVYFDLVTNMIYWSYR